MMSNEGDQCFQCQELGHIAHHYPNIRCFDCDEYGHVAVDCPDRIPPSGTPAHQKRHCSSTRHHSRSTSRHHHRDKHRYNRSRSQSHSHNYCSHSWNSSHSHKSHSRSYHRCPHRSTYITVTQALIVTAATHHTEGHPHKEAHPLTPKITAELEHVLHTNQVGLHLLSLHPALAG